MGLFDFFIKTTEEKKTKKSTDERVYTDAANEEQSASISSSGKAFVPKRVKPESFEDIYALLDQLKLGHAIAVDCSELKETTAIRVLDILSGAVYALNGGWSTYGNEVFLFFLDNNAFGI